jgi:hypothetical protein
MKLTTKEKAERIIGSYEEMSRLLPFLCEGQDGVLEASVEVAREYLTLAERLEREQGEGELPVDEAWLRSIGFVLDEDVWFGRIPGSPNNRLYWLGGLVSVRGNNRRHVSLMAGVQARRQLLHLLQALNIQPQGATK